MTLFDIFYRHINWWHDIPEDKGKDTYHVVLDEMEVCAAEYAKELRGLGDKWKWVIENETIKLCGPNHYSLRLRGEKKEWHDMAVENFLSRIRKAMEHYCACDFRELPNNISLLYGIGPTEYEREWFNIKRVRKPHPEPQKDKSEELQGSGKEILPEALEMENLPTIYDDEETKQKEQRVFYKAIKNKWMKLNKASNGYIWDKTKGYNLLAYMCGKLYCDDDVVINIKGECELNKGGRLTIAAKLKELFGGVKVGQNRNELFRYKEPPPGWRTIDILFN